jgi:aspartokinase/homoserine dehydrogenase 1
MAVVVSAMSGVTDELIGLVHGARDRDEGYTARLEALKSRHAAEAAGLLGAAAAPLLATFEKDFKEIAEILRGVWLSRNASERTTELVSGYGELWSAQLLNAHLASLGIASRWLDARETHVVEPGDLTVVVDFEKSAAKLAAWLKGNPTDWLVITGFIASTPEGIPTTLKRNGSDFSASIFGALLDASEITIWTDVDGVMSADPRLVPEAVVLEDMSYDEATELAYFGAKVVHPSTMAPAIHKNIPIWIRNTFNPSYRGTKIHEKSASKLTVKGFASIGQMALVNVEGTGMIGVPGVAERLFGALRSERVSVVMISQASSEHSICFAIPKAQAELAKKTVEKAFFAELHHGQIERVEVREDSSVLAAVGDNMVETPGVSGRFFGALGRAGVNIRAIAQGSSERNISAVIGSADEKRALRAVHAAFFLSNQTLSIGLIGPGLIGGTLLEQFKTELDRLRTDFKVDLRVRGIMDSKRMLLDEKAIDLSSWKAALSERGTPADLDRFVAHVHASHLPHSVIIDASAGDAIFPHYTRFLESGIHVVTPNKKANTQSMAFYRELRAAARKGGRHFLYETNVGAGLPIINTLRELVRTGDRVLAIDGVLSGTLSFIFNSVGPSKPFSAAVQEAKSLGYTEPDPRDDLSGLDVARKLVILAREMGVNLELNDIQVESLVPAELTKASPEDFLKRLPSHDGAMAKKMEEAAARGEVLRYVGVVDAHGKASVKLKSYPASHAFARLTGTDNIVAFRTARYDKQPLIVQGPGAGPAVTAGGVFGDLLRLASYLGASL